MAPEAAHLVTNALALSARERAQSAHQRLLSLDEGTDADPAEAWIAELEQRAREARSGSITTEEWVAVKARLTERWPRPQDAGVRLHPGAAADLPSAGDGYDLQVPGLGADLVDEVDRALDAIAGRPLTWPLWPGIGEPVGVRRFLLARCPFSVGYVVEGEDVVVLAIAHVRRRPGYWADRPPASR